MGKAKLTKMFMNVSTTMLAFTGVCSHSKAAEYFASTILGRAYIGCKCANWATFQKGSCACTNGPLMGEFVDQTYELLDNSFRNNTITLICFHNFSARGAYY